MMPRHGRNPIALFQNAEPTLLASTALERVSASNTGQYFPPGLQYVFMSHNMAAPAGGLYGGRNAGFRNDHRLDYRVPPGEMERLQKKEISLGDAKVQHRATCFVISPEMACPRRVV